jgi:hypothetical protein
MYRLSLLIPILLFSAMMFGQVNENGGYVTYGGPREYVSPFAPLVVTPSVSLEHFSPSPAGASNATGQNVAGATNSTLSLPSSSGAQFAQPIWYLPVAPVVERESAPEGATIRQSRNDFGAAQFENSIGLAQLLAQEHYQKSKLVQTARVYTNQDVEQVRDRIVQDEGTVKVGGKVEHLQ